MSETNQLNNSTRITTRFDINYNIHCNKMTSILLGRIDRLLSFVVVFLGGAVFADVKNSIWYGLIIAVSMALKQVFQYSESSAKADLQYKAYLSLLRDELHVKSDNELTQKIKEIEKNDIHYLKSIEFAAMQRATIILGYKTNRSDAVYLTKIQKLIAWLAGDLPEQKDYEKCIED